MSPSFLGDLDKLVLPEVALGGGGGPQQDGLVGHLNMSGLSVSLGVDGHGLDTQPLGGVDDPTSDLAAIGDQNLKQN